MLLIYDNEQVMIGKSLEEMSAVMDAWFKITDDLQKSGNLLAGYALQPTATATTVRANDSGRVASNGPFAETKEQLGGYYMIEANDLDEAIEWAGKLPNLPTGGTVEVRPIMEFDH